MTLDAFNSLEEKPRRRVLRPVLGALAAAYVVLCLAANLWVLLLADVGPALPPLKIERAPVLADPQVLHWSSLALPAGPVAVPYQAGGYEITRVAPAELTVFYRHARVGAEARVLVFAQPPQPRWRLLAPWPGSRLLDDGWSADRLANALEVSRHPAPWDRLFPSRLWRWVELRQVRARVASEDGGQPQRAWILRRGAMTAIAREHDLAPGPDRRLAVTVFRGGRPLDLRLAFAREHEDNRALTRAWLDGLAAVAERRPDNQAGLNACEGLPTAQPNEPAIRLCRELHLLALWQMQGQDANAAAQLVDAYVFARDRSGLATLRDQFAPAAADDAATRRLLVRVEEALHRLDEERRAAETAAPGKDEE